MPSKNIIKKYVADGIYHAYNRGVEKRDIFMDSEDYAFFLFLLKTYLTKPDSSMKEFNPFNIPYKESVIKRGAYCERIDLLAFALMPNHYHLLLKIHDPAALTDFIKTIMTIYVMYFNKKYDRVGSLFQGIYKATLIENDDYLIHLARYIHLNPINNGHGDYNINNKTNVFEKLPDHFTSYPYYLDLKKSNWLKPKLILDYYKNINEFKKFTEELEIDGSNYLGKYALD